MPLHRTSAGTCERTASGSGHWGPFCRAASRLRRPETALVEERYKASRIFARISVSNTAANFAKSNGFSMGGAARSPPTILRASAIAPSQWTRDLPKRPTPPGYDGRCRAHRLPSAATAERSSKALRRRCRTPEATWQCSARHRSH
jgi:hypothetical protein